MCSSEYNDCPTYRSTEVRVNSVESTGPIASNEMTGLILAGGKGTRMGHVDKGLQLLRGYPMVMHAIARLAPQVGPMLINANQNLDVYRDLGYPVVPDVIDGFAGPLAGMHAGLGRCQTPYLLSVPCDSPFLPVDLAARLGAALSGSGAAVAFVVSLGRSHPVFALMRVTVASQLAAFLTSGGRKIDSWYANLAQVEVNFDDEADAFRNINTRDELRASEATPNEVR